MSLLSFAKKIAGKQKQEKPAQEKKQSAPAEVAKVPAGVTAGAIDLMPLVTEKSVATHAQANTLAFRVHSHVTKGQIKRAVQERYKVRPVAVRTVAVQPKIRRRGRTEGRTAFWKKAYVTLPEGATIDVTA